MAAQKKKYIDGYEMVDGCCKPTNMNDDESDELHAQRYKHV